jgi:hypothetical protein
MKTVWKVVVIIIIIGLAIGFYLGSTIDLTDLIEDRRFGGRVLLIVRSIKWM